MKVDVDEVECSVVSVEDAEIICTTGRRAIFRAPVLEVIISGKGMAAANDLSFLYIDRWSAVTTWGGQAPPRYPEAKIPFPFSKYQPDCQEQIVTTYLLNALHARKMCDVVGS